MFRLLLFYGHFVFFLRRAGMVSNKRFCRIEVHTNQERCSLSCTYTNQSLRSHLDKLGGGMINQHTTNRPMDSRKLWRDFLQTPLAQLMGKTSHAYSKDYPNPYHQEGSVLTHTEMVYREMQRMIETLNPPPEMANRLLELAMYHDTGKVFAYQLNHEKKRKSFVGHPGWSALLFADRTIEKLQHGDALPPHWQEQTAAIALHDQFLDFMIDLQADQVKPSRQKRWQRMLSAQPVLFFYLTLLALADQHGRCGIGQDNHWEKIPQIVEAPKPSYPLYVFNKQQLMHETAQMIRERPTLLLLCGVSGSGKTHFRKELVEAYPDQSYVFSSDEFVSQVAAEHGVDYNAVFQRPDLQPLCRQRLHAQTEISLQGKDLSLIIVDLTNLTSKSRVANVQYLSDLYSHYHGGVKPCVVSCTFYTPLSTIQDRLKARMNQPVPDEVIKDQIGRFVPPLFYEGHADDPIYHAQLVYFETSHHVNPLG